MRKVLVNIVVVLISCNPLTSAFAENSGSFDPPERSGGATGTVGPGGGTNVPYTPPSDKSDDPPPSGDSGNSSQPKEAEGPEYFGGEAVEKELGTTGKIRTW